MGMVKNRTFGVRSICLFINGAGLWGNRSADICGIPMQSVWQAVLYLCTLTLQYLWIIKGLEAEFYNKGPSVINILIGRGAQWSFSWKMVQEHIMEEILGYPLTLS